MRKVAEYSHIMGGILLVRDRRYGEPLPKNLPICLAVDDLSLPFSGGQ